MRTSAATSRRDPVASPAPCLLVRDEAALSMEERAQLERAGLLGRAPHQAWTSTGSSAELGYATHGVFRYFGKFPPTLAAHLLARYSEPGDWVLDPMVGSGTTAVEALLAGRHAIARDVSPLSLMLTRVKTTLVPLEESEAACARVEDRYRRRRRAGLPAPVGLRDPAHWFLPETLSSLGRLRAAIEEEPSSAVQELLLVAFAGTVRRVSLATTQQGRLFLDAKTAQEDAWPTFARQFKRASRAVAALPEAGTRMVVEERSVLEAPVAALERRPRLVIAHPPYFNNYRYSGVNSLELAWLGIDHRQVCRGEIREFFKIGKPENAERYLDDLAVAVGHLTAELAPGGRLALMMGDTVLRGEHVTVTARLLARLERTPLALELLALRVPQFTEASWVASQRRTGARVGVAMSDFVLVFRRKGRR